MYEDIEAVLDEHVRPLLRTHGGEMEIIEVEDGVVRFKLKGKCAGCPAADLTTEELIQTALTEHLPHIKRAAMVFSFRPPMCSTLPRKVTSPVIAISRLTGAPVRADTMAVVMAMPAEGPSLGTAPSGKWT